MSEVKYAEDRPKDCRYCYFWSGRKRPVIWVVKKTATTGYVRRDPAQRIDGCPYRQEPKCVSLCMKKILKDWKGEKLIVLVDTERR